MGGDIAAWCAYKGFRVTLQDQTPGKNCTSNGQSLAIIGE